MSDRIPRVLAITAPDAPLDQRFERWLGELVAAGVDGVQIRRKELGDRELLALVERARAVLAGTPVALLVNGRADVALAAGLIGPRSETAGGVHLPAAGLPTGELRRWLDRRVSGGRPVLIGRSTHHLAELARERRDGADYATYGPVFPTPGKDRYGRPKGLDGPEGLRAACAAGLPILALGGVSPDEVATVAEAGAAGVAAIRACSGRGEAEALVAAARAAFPRPSPAGDG